LIKVLRRIKVHQKKPLQLIPGHIRMSRVP
jgi:hypothetical protein